MRECILGSAKISLKRAVYFVIAIMVGFAATSRPASATLSASRPNMPNIKVTHRYAMGFPRLLSPRLLSLESGSFGAIAPLTADANTRALWSFDHDTASTVSDSTGSPLNGAATDAALTAVPGLDSTFANGRTFHAATSRLQFGATHTSKLDFVDQSALSFEAVVWINSVNPPLSTIFDNGELRVQLVENRLAAYVHGISGMKGLQSEAALAPETPHRISVNYEDGVLALADNGVVLGSVDTRVTKIAPTALQNETITVGGAFEGYLDDIRISNIARMDIHAPTIEIVDPDLSQTETNPRPNFQINLADVGSGIDVNSVQVFLNGVPQDGLTITNASVSGEMNTDLVSGENVLEISVADLAGNVTDLKTELTTDLPTTPSIVNLWGGWDTCVVTAPDGSVYCWGLNNKNQLLDGTYSQPVASPRKMPGLTDIVSVQTGDTHICALKKDRTLVCWGWNDYGQVGNGTFSSSALPTPVIGLSNIQQYSVGLGHVCAINDSRQVYCWGLNDHGQADTQDTANQSIPVLIPNLSNVAAIGAGYQYTCALIQDGTVQCWGINTYGQLGNGTNTDSLTPVTVHGITNAVELSVGLYHACVRTSDGLIQCWGYNGYGELGDSTTTNSNVPVTHPTLSNVLQVDAGQYQTCALDLNHHLNCWGAGFNGQLGNGSFNNSNTPVQVSNLDSIHQYSIGQQEGCVVQDDSKLKCWGGNDNGQVGDGTFLNRATPVEIHLPNASSSLSFSLLVSGDLAQCGRREDGRNFCWGRGDRGTIGNGYKYTQTVPIEILNNFIHFSLGFIHTCGSTIDGDVWCWGANGNGQLGPNTPLLHDNPNPVQVSGVSNAIDLAASAESNCALIDDHTIRCWGDDFLGQLGDGTYNPSATPVTIQGINNAIQIASSAKSEHFCAVLQTGEVACWGSNSHGQIGINPNTIAASSFPTIIPGISNAVQVSVGGEYTCVLLQSGIIKCLGNNTNGQLGNNTTTDTYVPTEVFGLNSASQIVTGYGHACALLTSGITKCWGNNQEGELGVGTTQNSSVPITVSDELHNLHAGSYFTCGFDPDQHIRCWGLNNYGQFGNGTFNNSSYPINVGF